MLSCLLAMAWAAASPNSLQIEEAFYKPAISSKAIHEPRPKLEDLGGTVHIFVRNTGRVSEPMRGLEIDGVAVEALETEGRVYWWRALPKTLEPGEVGLLTVNAPPTLLTPGATLTAQLGHGATASNSIRLQIPDRKFAANSLSLAFVYYEKEICHVFVRNDSRDVYEIDSVHLENIATGKPEFLQRKIPPGETTLIRIPLRNAPSSGRMLPLRLTAHKSDDAKAILTLGAPTRAMPLNFPVGTRDTSAWRNEAKLADLAANHITTLVFGAEGKDKPSSEETRCLDDLCAKYHLRALSFQGYPDIHLDFLRRRNGFPRLAALMIDDAPDRALDEPDKPQAVTRIAQVTDLAREAAPNTPININLSRSRLFGEYAPLADIPSMDAYRVGAPHADSGPASWGNLLEAAGSYTWDLKRNSEPSPIWVWSQGTHLWDERLWVHHQLGRAVPTPDEARVQLYFELARGAKGIFWFATETPDEALEALRAARKNAPNMAMLRGKTEAEIDSMAHQIAGQFGETLEAMKKMSRQIHALRGLLARSEPSRIVTTVSASSIGRLDASALVGERAVVVILTNYEYEMKTTGYVFSPQQNVRLRVMVPSWISFREAFWVSEEGTRPATWKKEGREVEIDAGEIPVGAILVLAGDPSVRKEIDAGFKEPRATARR